MSLNPVSLDFPKLFLTERHVHTHLEFPTLLVLSMLYSFYIPFLPPFTARNFTIILKRCDERRYLCLVFILEENVQ